VLAATFGDLPSIDASGQHYICDQHVRDVISGIAAAG
jgi:hypothetical protein